jgi:hypothetical protein
MKAVRAASLEELLALGWLPEAVARALYAHLHLPGPRPGAPRRLPVAAARPAARPAVPAPGRDASEDGGTVSASGELRQ